MESNGSAGMQWFYGLPGDVLALLFSYLTIGDVYGRLGTVSSAGAALAHEHIGGLDCLDVSPHATITDGALRSLARLAVRSTALSVGPALRVRDFVACLRAAQRHMTRLQAVIVCASGFPLSALLDNCVLELLRAMPHGCTAAHVVSACTLRQLVQRLTLDSTDALRVAWRVLLHALHGSDAQLHSQLRSNPAATHCLPICALHSACRVMAFYVPFRDIVAAALHMHFDHETHPRCFGQAERLRQQLGCLLFPYMPPGNALAARSHGSAQGAQGTAALSAGSAVGTMVAGGDPCGVVAVTAADAAVAASAARGAASTTEQAAAATDLNALLADLPVELLDEPSAAQPPDMRCTEPGCCAPASSCSADIGAMTFDPAATLCVRAVPAPSVRPVAPPAAVALVSSEQDFDPLQAHVVLRSLQSAPVTAEPPPALALQRQASRMDGDADTPAPPPAPPRALRRFGSRLEASALSPAPADDCSPAALPDSGARQRAGREAARVPIPALPPALVRAHPLGLQRRDESTEASTDFVPAGLHITSASTATPLVALQSLAPLTVADAGDQYVAGVQGSLGAYSPRQLVPIAGYGQPACSESAAAGIRTVPGTVVDFYNVVFLPAASGIVSELRRVWQ